jgi:hypothetical protein
MPRSSLDAISLVVVWPEDVVTTHSAQTNRGRLARKSLYSGGCEGVDANLVRMEPRIKLVSSKIKTVISVRFWNLTLPDALLPHAKPLYHWSFPLAAGVAAAGL